MKSLNSYLDFFYRPIKKLKLKGPYKTNDLDKVPNISGLYIVFSGRISNPMEYLIYIGQSEQLKDRMGENHNHMKDFIKENKKHPNHQILWYTIELPNISNDLLNNLEGAFIFKYKPIINTLDVDNNNGDGLKIENPEELYSSEVQVSYPRSKKGSWG